MAVTERNLTSTGATSYTFPFEYLKTADVKVSVDGTATTEYTIPSGAPTTVQFNTGHVPASGKAIRIYRDTDVDNLSATFYAGSAIKSQDLNNNFNQNLYVTQEAKRDVASAWQDGDETIISTETWVSDNTKVATTGAIDGRVDAKIDTALTTDVSGGDGVTIVDNNPDTGQIRVDLDADIATLKDMQSGAATQLAALTSTELAILDGATVSTAELNLLDGVTSTTAELNILDGVTATKDEINLLDGVTSTTAELNILDGVTATKDEINILDGVTSTTAELNILDGVTATKDEINILDGVTATAAELNILDGVTSTAAELNILDGVTATAAELNKLDGVTASTTELNKVDGLTASTTELNILDGVTATTAELNKTDGLTATPVELNTLDGVTSNTSELNKLDGYTGSTNDLNIVSGKSFKTSSGTLDTTSDTEIPSSKVIAAHVASSQTAIGGFVTIADEVSFPATANMPANGVVVSINNAAGVVVNGSGVSTTGRTTDGTPATVTINNFPSSLNGETLAAGVGLMVTATSTGNTYNYHKILAAETDVKQLSDDINDFNARYRVASSPPGSSNDAGDMYFDTSANKMKVYNGTTNAWDDVASVGDFFINTISSSSGTGGGSATFNNNAYRFTLSSAPTSAQQLIVSVNGVIQKPNAGTAQPSEGFAISGNDILFSTAPATGSDYFIITQGSSVSIGTPSDNTVTSAKIVDGTIVNGDISSTANIAGSKVADDSIPEVKLDVHNAPATGKYLKYTSNGMEWSDGASEGTDVKSTGESGTTKFLRVDGDGTCSWQVPPDTNTQVGGATGVDFDDNVKARFGTGNDLEIYHSGDVSRIRNTNDSGTFKIQATSNGENALNIVPNGTVEIYHDGNKKLETTATGINVTGAINVNGTALSTAPTITATADGAIAANKACCVNTDGSVSQIAETTTPSSIVSRSTANTGTGDYIMGDVVWITATDFIAGGRKMNDSNKAKRFYGKVNSGGTITLYSEQILGTNDSDIWNTRFATDTSTEIFLVLLQNDGANDIYIRAGEVNSNQTGVTFGSAWYAGIGTGQYASAVASNNNGEYMIGFIASDNQMHFKTITVNTSTLATTQSSSGTFSTFTASNTENTMSMVYVPSVGMYWCVMVISGNYMRSAWIKSNGSSSAPTCTTDSGVLTGGNLGTKPWLSLDPSTGKVILSYRSVNSNRPAARVLTITGSSSSPAVPTFSSETQLTTGSCDDIRHTWARDATSGNGKAVFYIHGDTSHIKCYTLSGTTLSDASNTLTLFNGHYQYAAIDANPSTGRIITATRDEANSYRLDFNCIDIPLTTTNWTSENFIGFSAGAYSDTNTATINVVGNTTTQSSLTPAQKYYVQTDGTIALTADSNGSVEAGTSLSSTKLLIKG